MSCSGPPVFHADVDFGVSGHQPKSAPVFERIRLFDFPETEHAGIEAACFGFRADGDGDLDVMEPQNVHQPVTVSLSLRI